ncbi:MAG: deoxynucleoside kinase [Bacteroidales bacterium]|nr:deoxynucleoside kinase [Bacteroidales bacterium]
MYIGIAGNIGCGKTTLTQILTETFGWKAHYETAETNPFLADFYADMRRWAFNLQVYFLTQRFQSIQRIRWSGETVVQDRTIYEDAFIFADNLYHMNLIDERDYNAYMELFKIMNSFLTPPDLLIYIRATVPTLMKQIRMRNRSYETGISPDYLRQLNERYESWIENYKGELLVIDVDGLDFANCEADRRKTLDIIARTIKTNADKKKDNNG